jgi:hypothetical protein
VPRFLYGLEVQNPTKTDIKKLEQLQRNVCRQFQCLPERTSSIAVYALTGAEPIEVTLDKYCINLFFGIARLDSTIEKQMLLWESANANANDTLFINKIAGILEKYGMHTPMELLRNLGTTYVFHIFISTTGDIPDRAWRPDPNNAYIIIK